MDNIRMIFEQEIAQKICMQKHIRETENELEMMKVQIKDKKRLQKERNVLTAQLSRDRKKLEVEYLRDGVFTLTQQINQLRNLFRHARDGDKPKGEEREGA